MNREIKFRCWDNVDYMSNPFTLGELQSVKIQFISNCIVMQYTGIKDKNDNDIYEGDILRISNFEIVAFESNGHAEPSPVFEDINCEVVFDESGFAFDGIDKGMIPLFAVNSEDYEVIGNIYQHKHLLNETNTA